MSNPVTELHNTTEAQCDPVATPAPRQHLNALLAIASGLAVANVYFAQPLLASMAHSLNTATESIGIVISATQCGYALGLLFLAPLGDLLERRKLIVTMLLVLSAALLAAVCATTLAPLLAAMSLVGLMAVVVQILVSYAAVLAPPGESGKAVGIVTSGVVLGILLARVVAGVLADLAGWRAIYLLSAGLVLLIALLLRKQLPREHHAAPPASYRQLLHSVVSLLLTLRILRIRATLALLTFFTFSVMWSALVLPLSVSPWFFSHTQTGLLGLAGVAGALAASGAGRWADRGHGQQTTAIALSLLLLSWLPLSMMGHSLLLLIAGVILLDFAVQAVHVSSQSMILAARPAASSRLVAAYMLFYSLGSGTGAVAATMIYARCGWSGVCLLGATASLLALLFWLATRKLS